MFRIKNNRYHNNVLLHESSKMPDMEIFGRIFEIIHFNIVCIFLQDV